MSAKQDSDENDIKKHNPTQMGAGIVFCGVMLTIAGLQLLWYARHDTMGIVVTCGFTMYGVITIAQGIRHARHPRSARVTAPSPLSHDGAVESPGAAFVNFLQERGM